MKIRNIAIIAHVDHGKTTLVDKMIYACKAIDNRKETKELILDNNCLLYTSPSPRDRTRSRMPSSA